MYQNLIKISSDTYFTVASSFQGNVLVKPQTNNQILAEIIAKKNSRKTLDYLLRSCPLRLRDFPTALITQEWSKISMNLQL